MFGRLALLLGLLAPAMPVAALYDRKKANGFLGPSPIRGSALLQTHKQRHTAGKRRQEYESSDVVYGVMTNGSPEYREKLAAQVETWAAGLARQGRFFSVAGRGSERLAAAGLVVQERCPDDKTGLACKEERLLEEGFRRGARWLVILGEDNYVDTARMEEALRNSSAGRQGAAPSVLGILGCGKGLGYCDEVDQLGGLCGGGGYALNRAALEVLMQDGKVSLRQEYREDKGEPGDMASSCAFRERGIQLVALNGLMGNRIMKEGDFESALKTRPITVHYCTPNVMRWVHASLQGASKQEVSVLQAVAFDGGCCCAWQDEDLQKCKNEHMGGRKPHSSSDLSSGSLIQGMMHAMQA